jgi:hypothetical protein
MDVIDLPVLPEDLPLLQALAYLHDVRRSALVTAIGGTPVILDAESLLAGGYNATTLLGAIAPVWTTAALPHGRIENDADQAMLRAELATTDAVAGIVTIARGAATIVTIAESVAERMLTQIAYCRCTGPDGHVVAPGRSATPGFCDFDGAALDCR